MVDLEAMAVDYARTRDPLERAEIVIGYQPLARRCARRLRRWDEPLEDLVQVCNVALIEALNRFQPGHGAMFRTYAERTMTGALQKHYRTVWRVYVPRKTQENYLRMRITAEALTGQLRRTPTLHETAHAARLTIDEALQATAAGASFFPDDQDWDEAATATWDNPADLDVHHLLARLSAFQRRCVYLRFFEEMTSTEIADQVGKSQPVVCETIRRALDRLRVLAA